jgi:hypothetical protein
MTVSAGFTVLAFSKHATILFSPELQHDLVWYVGTSVSKTHEARLLLQLKIEAVSYSKMFVPTYQTTWGLWFIF